ncbi:glycosyltransferase, partial [bacterium]|nr:glycosyltransferase [bacterium]
DTIQHAGVAFYYNTSTKMVIPFHIFTGFPRFAPAVIKEREFQVVTGACMLTPKTLFRDLGGFDEAYINCFEDVDYCLKLREAGYKVIYTPDAELTHFEGRTEGREDHHIQSGIQLQAKWAGKVQPDEHFYNEPEGFVIHQSGIDLTVHPGPEMMRWWELIQQLISLKQYRTALQEIEKFEAMTPANEFLEDAKQSCLQGLKQVEENKREKSAMNQESDDHGMSDNDSPLVSIVIPVRDNLQFTEKCLASITASPPAASYEIIVVDNSSTDGTGAFLSAKAATGELSFITNSPPRNFAASCNIGAQQAKGKHIVFLNNDIEAFPGWLDALVEVAERPEQIGAVGAKLLYPDGTIQHAGVAFHYFIKLQKYGPYHLFRKLPHTSPAVNKEREFQVVTGACLLTPRELFHAAGGFDEKYVNCFEDVDYCLRLRSMDYKVIYTPKAQLIHYEGQTPGRKDGEKESYDRLNELWGREMVADDIQILEDEGFALQEDDEGQVSIFPGQELQEWWKVIHQMTDIGQHQMVLEEIAKLEQIIGDKYGRLVKLKAESYLKLDDTRAARNQFARLQTIDPKKPDSFWGLTQVALREKKFDRAANYLNRILAEFPADPDYNQWQELSGELKIRSASMTPQKMVSQDAPVEELAV